MKISGMDIVISPYLGPTPRFQLSQNCPCTDEFRAEYNQWLREFFGIEEPMYIMDGRLFTSKPGFKWLQAQIVKGVS